MTPDPYSDQADTDQTASRANWLVRLMWTRALPGSVAVVAALTIPELSVGAGGLGSGDRDDNRTEPPSATGQRLVKWQASAGKQPLAGVRYGALLDIAAAKPPAAKLALSATAVTPEAALAQPSQPVAHAAPLVVSAPSLANAATAADSRADAVPEMAASEPSEEAVDLGLGKPALARPGAAAPMRDSVITVAVTQNALPGWPIPLPAGESQFAAVSIPPDQVAAMPVPVAAPTTSLARTVALPVPARGLPAGRTPSGDRAGMEQLNPALARPAGSTPEPTALSGDVASSTGPSRQLVQIAPSEPPLDLAALANLPVPVGAPNSRTAPRAVVPDGTTSTPLAAMPAAAAAPIAASATAPGLATNSAAPLALAIASRLVTRVDGKTAGTVDFEQTATGLKVRLGSIVEVLGDRYDSAEIARIQASAASNAYLSLADLQAQGIPISYDPVYDEFNVGHTDFRPKGASKVHMDQISAPERGLDTTAIGQVRRR